jgi:hypothetical protein
MWTSRSPSREYPVAGGQFRKQADRGHGCQPILRGRTLSDDTDDTEVSKVKRKTVIAVAAVIGSLAMLLLVAPMSGPARAQSEGEAITEGTGEGVVSAHTAPFTTPTRSFHHSLGFSFDYPSGLTTVEFGSGRDSYVFLVSSNPGYESPIQAYEHARASVRILPGRAPGNAERHTNPNGVTYQLYREGSRWYLICQGSNYYVHFQFRSRDEAMARGVAHTFST